MLKPLTILALSVFVLTAFRPVVLAQADSLKPKIQLHFIKHTVEVIPGEVFHNVLVIENEKKLTDEFDIFINSPNHWKVIGQSSQRIRIDPGERIHLPVQVVSSGESKGGVGYAVTAVMNDLNGNMIKAESCLLNIPRESQLDVSVINDFKYFDLGSNEAEFQVRIKNTGNTDQQINIRIDPSHSLTIPNMESDFSQTNLLLIPKNDTILNFKVKLKAEVEKELFRNHNAEILISGSDTIIKQTAWFSYLDWNYTNFISDTQRPLVLEAILNDAFGSGGTNLQAMAYGNILFKKNQNLRYNFQKMGKRNYANSGLWYNSNMFVEYSKDRKTIIGIGDYRENMEQSLYGRGAWTELDIKKNHNIKFALTKKIDYDAAASGLAYSKQFDKPLTATIGSAYTYNNKNPQRSLSGFLKISAFSKPIGHFSILYGISQTEYYVPDYPASTYTGHGIKTRFTSSFNIFQVNYSLSYGTPLYSGIDKGRLLSYLNVNTELSDRFELYTHYSKQDYRPAVITENQVQHIGLNTNDKTYSYLRYKLQKNIILHIGPDFEYKSTNAYSNETESLFATRRFGADAGFRISEAYTSNSVAFSVRYGYTFLAQTPETLREKYNVTKEFPATELKLNIRRNYWSVYVLFQQGPKSIAEEYAFANNPTVIRSLMILPTYERYLYKRELKFTMRANYISNLTAKSSRINMSTRLDWFLPKGWSAFVDNTFSLSYQSPYLEASNMLTGTQTTNYLRIGLKKIFNFNQPRVKYIDVDAIFYRDNNGDNKHSANEPGVSNVLAGIKRIPGEDEDKSIRSEFSSVELLSEMEGKVRLNDIPEGTYEISYIPTNGREGNFITDRAVKTIELTGDSTLHIPFTDRNKVFGHVIINKAENTINDNPSLDNITIMATSGSHKPERTLTNKEGYFEMYIPVSDYYQIRIENFDSEHYALRQPFYIIKFNGYKEFELNFVFDEKQRRVIFDDDLSFIDTEITDENETADETADNNDNELDDPVLDDVIQPLHQINMKGEIREEATMSPVHATVQIINENTGLVITETISSMRTGVYATSFISSDEVYMKVEAKGYRVYKENVRTGRITTFDNISKDVVLKPIIIGQSLETSELSFEPGSTKLSSGTKAELENMLITLHENNTIEINISGHTDNQEAATENADELSLKRAQTVAKYLTDRGISSDRINNISGKANHEPKVTETDARSRATNRRVEIRISYF